MSAFGQRLVWLAALAGLAAFVIADHTARPELDHDALEQRRASGVFMCAPCGQACDPGPGESR